MLALYCMRYEIDGGWSWLMRVIRRCSLCAEPSNRVCLFSSSFGTLQSHFMGGPFLVEGEGEKAESPARLLGNLC